MRSAAIASIFAAAVGTAVVGCGNKKKKNVDAKLASRYQVLPPKKVPDYLKDTVLERCEVGNTTPFPVSGFGLVANLRGTGDTFAGTTVRQYIVTQMVKRGMGSRVNGTENMQPEEILKDPKWAIVRVDGLLPPGVRKHQRFDAYVSALDGNNTSSLAHGDLYRTDLKVNGANVQAPGYTVDVWATAEGSVFVNPAYALSGGSDSASGGAAPPSAESRSSLRQGTILSGGVAQMDRPIMLRVRQPQLSMSRYIESRIDKAFQDTTTASAKDEAMISLLVPERYGSDWEHFTQVVLHLFLNSSPEFGVLKAKQLAEQAVKPDAPLLDISYCWEGLGATALPQITPLMTNEKPEVAYAAARAAVFLGDASAEDVLVAMAKTDGHAFQLEAVKTLGSLPSSPVVNQMLRTLLTSEQNLVRLEAYRALARNGDNSIISRPIVRANGEPSFMLDIVKTPGGAPLIYASRTGTPRIAVFGDRPRVNLPIMFTAMDNHFSISAQDPNRPMLEMFYRGADVSKPVSVNSSPDLAEFVARLGGDGAPGEQRLSFNYNEVVALLQRMSDQQRLSAPQPGLGTPRKAVAFVLQDLPRSERSVEEAPAIPEAPEIPLAPAPPPTTLGSANQ